MAAKKGYLFKVDFKEVVRHTGGVEEVKHEFTGYFGLSVGSVEPDYSTVGFNNYNFFTDKVSSDVAFLGMTMPAYPGNTASVNPAMWLPQCKIDRNNEFLFTYTSTETYYRIYFSEDTFISFTRKTGEGAYFWEGYQSNFSGDQSLFCFPMTQLNPANTWNDGAWGRAFVVSDMDDSGHIPYDSEVKSGCYTIEMMLQWNTGLPVVDQDPHLRIATWGVMPRGAKEFWNYVIDNFSLAIDPYSPGGIAEPGGGDGTFDWESDVVPVQPLPEISVTDAGFVNLYVPTKAQLQNLCRYLWSSAFDIDSLKRIFLEPMDVIIGLSILPITPEEVDADLGTILVGQYSSGIESYVAHRQYVQVDCGTVTIEPKWGAYLDFSPYSKLQLYLPYIGFVDITPDDCMNGTIRVVYNLDILSGACLAQIECTTPGKDGELNSHVLYEYTGNCSVECPITSGQYRNIISSMFNIASGVVETTATGNPTPILNSAIDTVKGITKPTVSRAGGPGKNTGILGHQAPFLVLTCPRMIIPGQQNAMIGYPSYVTLNLGDLNGYTQVDTIHLFGVPASKDEQDEIIDLLQKGVFL